MLAVIGLGYVGVTSLLCFKSLGVDVIGYDNDEKVVDKLQNGVLNIADDKLQHALGMYHNNIQFCSDFSALKDADEALICVPTDGRNGCLDLSAVVSVLEMIKTTNIQTVWIRSTIDNPKLFDEFAGYSFNVFSYPEFLREGKCWDDFFDPPLIVLGQTRNIRTIVSNILSKNFNTVNVASPKEALSVKLFCNAFHAFKVAFANELTNVNWLSDINIKRVMEIFCTDHKLNLSKYYMTPGLPFGGPCLPKDTAALANSLRSNETGTLLHAVLDQNERHKRMYAEKLCNLAEGNIGFFGYEFKVGTGDIRNSPLLEIAKIVSEKRAVYICDEPHPPTQHSRYKISQDDNIKHIDTLNDLETICDVIITEHEISGSKAIYWKDI